MVIWSPRRPQAGGGSSFCGFVYLDETNPGGEMKYVFALIFFLYLTHESEELKVKLNGNIGDCERIRLSAIDSESLKEVKGVSITNFAVDFLTSKNKSRAVVMGTGDRFSEDLCGAFEQCGDTLKFVVIEVHAKWNDRHVHLANSDTIEIKN